MSFPTDDVGKVSQEARDVMLDLILAWARLDTACSIWVTLAFGMCTDSGPILLGNMDTKSKLDRLKALAKHHKLATAAKSIDNLKKTVEHYAQIRNAIAHSMLAGERVSKPGVIVFSPLKPAPGVLAHMMIQEVRLEAMKKAAAFARDAGDRLTSAQHMLIGRPTRQPAELGEFPSFPNPNPDAPTRNRRRRPS